jgi:hypothetical protein
MLPRELAEKNVPRASWMVKEVVVFEAQPDYLGGFGVVGMMHLGIRRATDSAWAAGNFAAVPVNMGVGTSVGPATSFWRELVCLAPDPHGQGMTSVAGLLAGTRVVATFRAGMGLRAAHGGTPRKSNGRHSSHEV